MGFWAYFIIGVIISVVYYAWKDAKHKESLELQAQAEQQEFRDSEGTDGWM